MRGGTTTQDVLLNAAGMLAPVVALVPTLPSSQDFPGGARDVQLAERAVAVANNWPALVCIGAFAFLVLLGLAIGQIFRCKPLPDTGSLVGFVLAAALVAVAHLWYLLDRDGFLDRAHYTAAISMFGLIAITAINDGRRVICEEPRKRWLGYAYVVIGLLMVLAGGAIIGYLGEVQEWRQAVLLAEFVLTVLFGLFWTAQTADLWNYTSRAESIAEQQAADAAGTVVGSPDK